MTGCDEKWIEKEKERENEQIAEMRELIGRDIASNRVNLRRFRTSYFNVPSLEFLPLPVS